MATVTVTVSGVKNDRGDIVGGLYGRDAWRRFGKGAPMAERKVAAALGTVTLVFSDVPEGRWGLAVFHDANRNGRMDLNIVGVPAEGRGYPNIGAPLGAPLFEDASIEVAGDLTVGVKLSYLAGDGQR